MTDPNDPLTDDGSTPAAHKTWLQKHSALLFMLAFCALIVLMIVVEKLNS